MLDLNLEHHDDQDHEHHLFSPKIQSSSSSSSLSNPIFFMTPSQDQPNFYMESHPQQEDCKTVSQGCDQVQVDESDNGLKFTIRRRSESSNEYETENNSVKWMSSKMRMMRKMITSDTITNFTTTAAATTTKFDHQNHNNKLQQQQQQPLSPQETDNSSNSSSCNNSVRVCSDCNTTKTPLWRSGPRGPKSLCNACGIRQRKARRAMAAAAAAAKGTIAPATNPPAKKVQHKNKRSSLNYNNQVPQLKKRCKISAAPPGAATSGRKKICFEDLRISLSKSSAFQQVFPQDEKEAAILLMALSYGLVHG